MDPKRALTSVDLAALAGELAIFEEARVEKTYLYDDDLVRIKMRSFDHGRVELLIDVGETKHVRVADPDNVPSAPDRPPNFAMMLRNRIEGAEFVGAEQFEFDRILELRFEREDSSTTIVAELFGDGNLAVLDETGAVVDCLETVRLKSRTVAPGSQYEFPEARFNPLAVDRETFGARFSQSDTDVVRTLATQFNFGGTWAEELCTRTGVEKTQDVPATDEEEIDALYRVVGDLAATLQGGPLEPSLYRDPEQDERLVDVTPVPMEEHAALDRSACDSFREALDRYFTDLDSDQSGAGTQAGGDQGPDYAAEIEKRERIIEQQQQAIEDFQAQAQTEREKAKSLYANYDLVDEILSTIQAARESGTPWDEIEARFEAGANEGIEAAQAVESIDSSEGTVTVRINDEPVSLLVRDGVEKNADRLYTEAKRIEEKQAGAEEAIEATKAELESLREERAAAEAGAGSDADEPDEDSRASEAETDWLSRSSIPIRQSEQWFERFRWFHTSDGFLVIGGRNADQNEELVTKYLDKGDRFFHAEAHGGPVTILKATDPGEAYREKTIPEQSIEEAATFAISYASVWKDGRYTGDAYMVDHDQVSKTPESGEYLEKGGFAIRGDRRYLRDLGVGVAVGITCEPETRVIGGPPRPIVDRAATAIEVEPGKYAQNDIAKRLYRVFKSRFADETFVRKIASPDLIQEFLPPGTSSMVEASDRA